MISIQAERHGHNNTYKRVDTDASGQIMATRTSEYSVYSVRKKTGEVYFSLVDKDGKTDPRFHKYINDTMVANRRSPNTRRKAAGIICQFYCFLELMGYSIYALGLDEIYQLRTFFQSGTGHQVANETVNDYLSTIRGYLRENGIRCDSIFAQRNTSGKYPLGNDFRPSNEYPCYESNLPTDPHKAERVPKFIKLDEYNKLIKLARQRNDWQGIMLMHLMFRYGMRLGECLGLTEEDIVTIPIKKKEIPTLILRNRVSDMPFQHCKYRIVPSSRDDYKNPSYVKQWQKDDFSHIYLTESTDFSKVLNKFVRQTRATMKKNCPQNYRSCIADIVDPESFKTKGLSDNRYIFVNHLGKRLSAQLWGQRLKEYFQQAGITIDTERKENNLSHRFRHGFAMMHARYMDPPVPQHELRLMMRHRNISSTGIYFNPTIEDEYDFKTKLQNKFYDSNPNLKAIIKDFLE